MGDLTELEAADQRDLALADAQYEIARLRFEAVRVRVSQKYELNAGDQVNIDTGVITRAPGVPLNGATGEAAAA